MQVLSPGKFEITLGGQTRVITVALGLKTELYRLITKKQLEYNALNSKIFIEQEFKDRIQELTDSLATAEQAEERNEVEIANLRNELENAYNAAYADLELKKAATVAEMSLGVVDITQTAVAESLALLLSERGEKGEVTKAVTPDDILWGEIYADAQDELLDLLTEVTDYITSSLKKISKMNNLVAAVTNQQ